MTDREQIGRTMREEYESRWQRGDPWDDGDPPRAAFEARKNVRQVALLGDRRYGRVLEIGCGNGNFTVHLAGLADRVAALDIAASAVERASRRVEAAGRANVAFLTANIFDDDSFGPEPWDAVTMIETVYSLGWLYPLFDVAWLAERVFDAVRPGGRFLLCNTYGGEHHYLLRPYLIDTYRDLFRNVGFRVEAEEVFGRDAGDDLLPVLMTRFGKPESG